MQISILSYILGVIESIEHQDYWKDLRVSRYNPYDDKVREMNTTSSFENIGSDSKKIARYDRNPSEIIDHETGIELTINVIFAGA